MRTAPYWPQAYTGDGVTSEFLLNFAILDQAHLRVIVAGVLKTLGVDYAVETPAPVTPALYTSHIPGADTSKYKVRFLTGKIPANSATIKFYRNTPIARPDPANKIEVGPDTALYAYFRQQERDDALRFVGGADGGDYGQTALLAHTALTFVAPCDGYVTELQTLVTGAVTTGGTLAVDVQGAAVTGMSATIANSAAVGANQVVGPTAQQATYTQVRKGQLINVTPAGFATAGDVRVAVAIQPADF